MGGLGEQARLDLGAGGELVSDAQRPPQVEAPTTNRQHCRASAPEALEEYWEEIGGKPAPSTKRPAKGNKKRKAADTPKGANSRTKRSKSETPELSTKKKRGGGEAKDGNNDFKLPKGSWEEQVAAIDTIEETLDDKGVMQRFVYVLWSNGSKTRHQLGTVNQKCPQKMLEYYESHL
jgi:chromobox protein 1